MSFVLAVRMKVAEGNEERAAEIIPELAQASRGEPGCELYIPCRDPDELRAERQRREEERGEERAASQSTTVS